MVWAQDTNLDFMVWAFQISVTPELERSWKQAKLVCSWLQLALHQHKEQGSLRAPNLLGARTAATEASRVGAGLEPPQGQRPDIAAL